MSAYSGSKIPSNNDEDNTLLKKIAMALADAFPLAQSAYPSGGGGGGSAPTYTAASGTVNLSSATSSIIVPSVDNARIVAISNNDPATTIYINPAGTAVPNSQGIAIPPGGVWESPGPFREEVQGTVKAGDNPVTISFTTYTLDS